MNETSCFCNRSKEKPYDDVVNKISAAQNICLRDDSDDADVTKEADKTAILNQIGLTSQEQSYVIGLSGTLTVDTPSIITFQISKSPNSAVVYKEISNEVTLQKINALNTSIDTQIQQANALILINNKQFTISNIASTFISDSNLDFTNDNTISDGCQAAPGSMNWYNQKLYLIANCGGSYIEEHTLTQDDNGNYYPPSTRNDIDANDSVPSNFSESNNNIYFNTTDLNVWTINNSIATEISNDQTYIHNKSIYICNIDNKFYVCTNEGLYESTDDGASWSLTSLGSLVNITRVISSVDGKEIIAVSSTEIYESSNEGQTFNSIYTGTNLNINSLFISKNNNLYFGDKDKGLNKIDLSDLTTVQPLVSPNIGTSDNVKSMIQTADGTLLVLTNSHVVYLQEV